MNERKLLEYRSISEWYAFTLCIIGLILLCFNIDYLNYIGFGVIPSAGIPIMFHYLRKNYYFKIKDKNTCPTMRDQYAAGLTKLLRHSIRLIAVSWVVFAGAVIAVHFYSDSEIFKASFGTYLVLIIPFLICERKMLSQLK